MAKSKKSRKKDRSQSISSPDLVSTGASFLQNTLLHYVLIVVLGFALYGNTLKHGYTQDDAIVIYDNMYTTQGIKGIPGLLKYDTFKGFFKVEGKDKLVSGGRYRPLTPVMFALEWQLFARPERDEQGQIKKDQDGNLIYKGSTMMGHFGNIAFFCLCGMVLYLLLVELLKTRFDTNMSRFIALLTALLFIAHPIHTEAVANIKGRDEIITLLGSLGALYFSWQAWAQKQFGYHLLAALLFFLALMAKENAITFLAIVPLTFYFFTDSNVERIARQTIPFVAAAALFLAIRGAVLGWSLGEPSMELMNNPFLKLEAKQWVAFSFGEKMATITYTLGKYVQLLFFPHPLTHDYYPRHVNIMSWGDWQVLLSAALYLGMIIVAVIGFLKKDLLSFSILFFLATLSIVSNIVFPVGTNMSERFLFMPSVGFCLAIALLAGRLIRMQNPDKDRLPATAFQSMLIAGAAAVILLGGKTISRNTVWKSNYTLFTTDVQTSRNSAKLLNAVGGELTAKALKVKDDKEREALLKEAVSYLKSALKIHPTFKNSYLQLGNCHNYLKEYEESIRYFSAVLALNPNDPNGTNNLGITYRDAGRYFGEKKGDMEKALRYLEKAYEFRPNDYETLRLLGVANGMQGNHSRAISFFEKAANTRPNHADAWMNLSNAWRYGGDDAKVLEYLQKARQIDPNVGQRK
ncbi:MAG: tetratricopeptide repeat protein [Bacteroidota bacterium]